VFGGKLNLAQSIYLTDNTVRSEHSLTLSSGHIIHHFRDKSTRATDFFAADDTSHRQLPHPWI